MTYFVYENWTNPHARVHKEDCSFCNEGEGIHNTSNQEHGKWTTKSFDTYKEACAEAQAFIKENNCEDQQYNCAHCHPELA